MVRNEGLTYRAKKTYELVPATQFPLSKSAVHVIVAWLVHADMNASDVVVQNLSS